MLQKIKDSKICTMIVQSQNIALYVVMIVALSVTYSSAKAIQKNYELEKRVNELNLELAVQEQENKNLALKNQYFKSDNYLDLAARKRLGKAAPGETMVFVSRDTAKSFIHAAPSSTDSRSSNPATTIVENWQAWLRVLTGRD